MNARTATAAFIGVFCVLAGLGLIDTRVPTRTVTEIVSVVQVPARAAPPAAAPAAAPVVDDGPEAEPAHAPPRAGPAARAPRAVAVVATPRRVASAHPVDRCRPGQCGTRLAAHKSPGAEPPPPPRPAPPNVFARIRELGHALRVKLERAGVVPACDDARGCQSAS